MIQAAKKAGLSQATLSGWETKRRVTPSFQKLVDFFRSLNIKWPESIEFFTSALKSFNGKIAFEINGGIIPNNLLITFLATYLAADFETDTNMQLEKTMECVVKLKKHLEAQRMAVQRRNEKNRGYVLVGLENLWNSPLPPPVKSK